MRIILITQDEPFFLADSLRFLLDRLPPEHAVVAAVVLAPSPFGKRLNFAQKMNETISIFGLPFFVHYAIRGALNKIQPSKSVVRALSRSGIPLLRDIQNINSSVVIDKLRSYQPDLLISIAGNQIFRKHLVGLATKGCLNLHSSLLPKNRGLMPTFWALQKGETTTGVSVFFVDEGIDTGPIIVQKSLVIRHKVIDLVIEESKRLGMEAILEAIDKIEADSYECLINNDSEMSYNKFPTRDDVRKFLAAGNRFY